MNLQRAIMTRNNRSGAARAGWDKTVQWWQTANDQYRVIVGALVPETVQVPTGSPVCWCAYVNSDGDAITQWHPYFSQNENCLDGLILPNGNHRECQWRYEYVDAIQWVAKKADGVVLKESASAYPGATFVQMLGSNHLQMRNDANTKQALLDLYKGNILPFFKTDEQ